jgi:hypothetical protein
VANVSDLLANFSESTHIAVHSPELKPLGVGPPHQCVSTRPHMPN